MSTYLKTIIGRWNDEDGQALAEYALIVALIVLACVLILAALGVAIGVPLGDVAARGFGGGGGS